MPPCYIECDISPDYQRQLKDLRKKYPHVDDDLCGAYAEIRQRPSAACRAVAVPGLLPPGSDAAIYKYKIASRDMKRGSSGGFRLVALYLPQRNLLIPVCMYTHVDYDSQPPNKDLKRWLNAVMDELPGLEEPPIRL